MKKLGLVLATAAATLFAASVFANGMVKCDGAMMKTADDCTKMGGKVMDTKNGEVKCDGAMMKADECTKMKGMVAK